MGDFSCPPFVFFIKNMDTSNEKKKIGVSRGKRDMSGGNNFNTQNQDNCDLTYKKNNLTGSKETQNYGKNKKDSEKNVIPSKVVYRIREKISNLQDKTISNLESMLNKCLNDCIQKDPLFLLSEVPKGTKCLIVDDYVNGIFRFLEISYGKTIIFVFENVENKTKATYTPVSFKDIQKFAILSEPPV